MSKIYEDNSFTIGNTPLVRLKKIGNGNILAKIESRNPSFSVKCRIGANMIWNAEKNGMKGAISKANDIALSNSRKYFLLKQFENPANPEIHEKTTGPEIWNDTDGNLDVFISAVGTGGTITGVTKYIKKIKRKKSLISIAVEPCESPVITQFLSKQEIKSGPHKIQGIGPGFIPKNLDLKLIDQVITVSSEESIFMAQQLMKKEGILAGISSGAALSAALKIQKQKNFSKKNIVIILPSSGERYLSTELFSNLSINKKSY